MQKDIGFDFDVEVDGNVSLDASFYMFVRMYLELSMSGKESKRVK